MVSWPSAVRGVVASARPGRGKIPLSSRHADAALITVAAGVRLLPFAPVDWVDIVDAAPIPVGVNFGATRHLLAPEYASSPGACMVVIVSERLGNPITGSHTSPVR
jgi:hypothetical protein